MEFKLKLGAKPKADFMLTRWRKSLVAALVLLIGTACLLGVQSAQRPAEAYALAAEMPRGALLYAQFSDWPTAIRVWQGSALKTRYEQSLNYQQLWERHLLNKLYERWQAFNGVAGFALDLNALASLAGQRAAFAVYDFRRLELVWLAPLNQTQQAACALLKAQGHFEERETAAGQPYFIQTVAADGGRQEQALAFAVVKDRLVLATSERWLVRTLATLRQPGSKDALSAEPKFSSLSHSLTPHFAAVWLDQERLNQDWYFRHYWLMGNVAELKHLRAGLFDLEMQTARWVERREFLTDGQASPLTPLTQPLPPAAWLRACALVPADAPYVQARACSNTDDTLVRDIRDTLFSRLDAPPSAQKMASTGWHWRRYYDDERAGALSTQDDRAWGTAADGSEYGSLDDRFNETVDDPEEAGNDYARTQLAALRSAGASHFNESLRRALAPAQPVLSVRVQRPPKSSALADFQHGVIVSLAQAEALDRSALESAINALAASRMCVAGTRPVLVWRAREQGRELALPWLGRTLVYAVRGQELFIGDSAALWQDGLAATAAKRVTLLPQPDSGELTLIRLSERTSAFDQVFATLDAPLVKAYWQERRGQDYTGREASREFFSGNLASLLDVAAPVREVVIQRQMTKERWREEVALVMTP